MGCGAHPKPKLIYFIEERSFDVHVSIWENVAFLTYLLFATLAELISWKINPNAHVHALENPFCLFKAKNNYFMGELSWRSCNFYLRKSCLVDFHSVWVLRTPRCQEWRNESKCLEECEIESVFCEWRKANNSPSSGSLQFSLLLADRRLTSWNSNQLNSPRFVSFLRYPLFWD